MKKPKETKRSEKKKTEKGKIQIDKRRKGES